MEDVPLTQTARPPGNTEPPVRFPLYVVEELVCCGLVRKGFLRSDELAHVMRCAVRQAWLDDQQLARTPGRKSRDKAHGEAFRTFFEFVEGAGDQLLLKPHAARGRRARTVLL